MDYYIYYRVEDQSSAALEAAVYGMQQGLRQDHGVSASLKRRPAVDSGPRTYMEVYAGAGATFEAALDEAVSGAGLSNLISGSRQTELFEDVAPCA